MNGHLCCCRGAAVLCKLKRASTHFPWTTNLQLTMNKSTKADQYFMCTESAPDCSLPAAVATLDVLTWADFL